jgi:hypothetical protein
MSAKKPEYPRSEGSDGSPFGSGESFYQYLEMDDSALLRGRESSAYYAASMASSLSL